MRYIILKICLLFCLLSFAQEKRIICNDTIMINTKSSDMHSIKINSNSIDLNIGNLNSEGYDGDVSVECLEDGFDLIITRKKGNEYQICHYIFSKENNLYSSAKQYVVLSNREEYLLYGTYNVSEKLQDIDFKKDLLAKNNTLTIQHITGFQDGNEIVAKSIFRTTKEFYKKKKYQEIITILNPFVVKESNIFENESIENLNDMGYYALKSGGYNEAIYILEYVIKQSPSRIVAYLNLADSQWELGQKRKAIENYKKYVEMMKSQKKDLKKIPDYVNERIQ